MHSPDRYEIWDLHCHLTGVPGRTADERMAGLMRIADRMHIDRLVFFMGLNWQHDPDPAEFRRQNDQVLQALSHWHDRAFGFAYVNPNYPEESLAEMDRVIRDGPLVGIKLWVAVRGNDPRLDAIIARAQELQAVVYQHTWQKAQGNLPGESTPLDLAALAARHPEMPLICGHTGGQWESGVRAIESQPNVVVGIGGSDPTDGMVDMAVRHLGDQRVLFGSDIGYRSFASQLSKVLGADLNEAAKQRILAGNLKRLLLPILRRTGRAE